MQEIFKSCKYFSCKNLARKNYKIILLQFLITILQEHCHANFSCKILVRFFISCKKNFIFSAKLVRFSARSCKFCKKNYFKIWIFLARWFLLSILSRKYQGNAKIPGVGNVYIMNRKCELSCTFHGISWPRKFRISSNAPFFIGILKLSPDLLVFSMHSRYTCNIVLDWSTKNNLSHCIK